MNHFSEKYPNLTLPQIKAVAALAAGQTNTAAAEAAGVHRATLHDWRRNPEFLKAITDARCLAIDALLDELKDLSRLALSVLRNLLTAEGVSHHVRLKAAVAVLNRLEQTGHQGWALSQPAQEPVHLKAESRLLQTDHIATQEIASQDIATQDASASASSAAEADFARHIPTVSINGVDFPIINLLTRPNDLCACQSGQTFSECCLPRQYQHAS
jgi:hypothetical protein